jgi:lysophospholipase L1-like esterase
VIFRTELTPDPLPRPVELADRIVTLGSCFAATMGQRAADHKLTVLNNPFGTVFNPVSLARLVGLALEEAEPDTRLYLERDGLWFHHDFHSSQHANSRAALQTGLVQTLAETGAALRRANWLWLTLGTALVYRHRDTGAVVANCHKQPGALFDKIMLPVDAIQQALDRLIGQLREANPGLPILLTVSPVRHLKDTLPLNAVSKATLRLAAHELTARHDYVHYFPACELLLDDLRDYRFYEADLLHPNAQAMTYIWEKLVQAAFSPDLRAFVAEWAGIRQALAHRPLNPDSPAHRRFRQQTHARLLALSQRVDVSSEIMSYEL